MLNIDDIKKMINRDGFQEIDLQFADFIIALASNKDPYLYLSAALSVYSLRNTHICLNIKEAAETMFPNYKSGIEIKFNSNEFKQIKLPAFEEWIGAISQYPEIISKNDNTPLVLDESARLYLHRYWSYENNLASMLLEKCSTNLTLTKKMSDNIIHSASKYFINSNKAEIDWQQIAVFACIVNQFTLITGGPGTGKTTVISTILGILLSQNTNLKIKLCAPTGKAAARLKESISDELKNLNIKISIENKMKALEAYTIHRLLKKKRLSPHFKRNADNPIDADVIIIDEASMIPLTLFSKLFDALRKNTKVILLGDKDQLASVEAGSVLSNIYEASTPNSFTNDFISEYKRFSLNTDLSSIKQTNQYPLVNCTVELKKSYRFNDLQGIGKVKTAIQNFDNSDLDYFLKILKQTTDEFKLNITPNKKIFEQTIIEYMKKLKVRLNHKDVNFLSYLNAPTVEEAFDIFSEFRILCSHYIGPYGVSTINKVIHSYLFDTEILPKGLPIIIKNNNSQLELFNGDIGLIWIDASGNKKAFFPIPGQNKFKSVSIYMLPEYEEVFAMTVHKSQGSGFQNVLMILPPIDSPILTRELIYTGITRAKIYCEVWANDDIFIKTVTRKTIRHSGLKDKLIPQ